MRAGGVCGHGGHARDVRGAVRRRGGGARGVGAGVGGGGRGGGGGVVGLSWDEGEGEGGGGEEEGEEGVLWGGVGGDGGVSLGRGWWDVRSGAGQGGGVRNMGFIVYVRSLARRFRDVDEVVAGSQVGHDWSRDRQVKIERRARVVEFKS